VVLKPAATSSRLPPMALVVSTGEDDHRAVATCEELASVGPYEVPCVQDPDALSLRDLVQLGRKAIDRTLGRKAAGTPPAFQHSVETVAAKEAAAASANTVETADSNITPELVDDWWSSTCKSVHHAHKPEQDTPELPHQAHDCCGCLEVELLAIKDEPPLVREDGTRAIDPVCQMFLQGHHSGAIRTKGTCAAVHMARLGLRELAGADLRVGLFDVGLAQFGPGMEHEAFCGGAFLPLAAIMKRGSPRRNWMHGLWAKTFEDELALALLPLELLRGRSKLEPAVVSGMRRPLRSHGHIMLRVSLHLYDTPLSLCLASPQHFCPSKAGTQIEVDTTQRGDPIQAMQAAAATAARAKWALGSVMPWLAVLRAISSEPAPAATFHTWWAVTSLIAPIWTLPILLVIGILLVAWKAACIAQQRLREEPLRLYVDEVQPIGAPSPGATEPATERVCKAVRNAAGSHLSVLEWANIANRALSHLERVSYVLTFGDGHTALLCGLAALVLAFLASLALLLLPLLLWIWCLRFLIWLLGCYALLPSRHRRPWVRRFHSYLDALERLLGVVAPYWLRLPDGVEHAHVALFERYAVIGG